MDVLIVVVIVLIPSLYYYRTSVVFRQADLNSLYFFIT